MAEVIKNRYDFVILFDVENGNPNGDPDAGNMPRMDQETGCGLVTDVCLKRKIRNYVEAAYDGKPGYRIYVKQNVPLERNNQEAYDYLGIKDSEIKNLKKNDPKLDLKIRDFMCENFFDIRTFGAVMTTFVKANLNCGQVRGPVQINFAKSIDPITTQEIIITRVTVASEEEKNEKGKNTMMGNKYIIPYALYRAEGFISANLAEKTTVFNEDDLKILWEAIINMFETDRSATRGKMSVRKLIIFKHASKFGNAPAYKLFERITVRRKDINNIARNYSDYEITIDKENLPENVELIEMA
jgi:CRISPR-associated protein Csd2